MRNEEYVLTLSGAAYIRYLFENTTDGWLIMGDEGEATAYPMAWDELAAWETENVFTGLCAALEAIAVRYEELGDPKENARLLTPEQLEVWNTYVAPYPDHGMDPEALFDAQMKEEVGDPLSISESRMLEQYRQWHWENALKRQPYMGCNPANLIQRARRYVRLLVLKAPQVVVDYERLCLAECLVLYRCAHPFHTCRCCGTVYMLDEAGVGWSICPTCSWEEDDSEENDYSAANGASLLEYRRRYEEKEDKAHV